MRIAKKGKPNKYIGINNKGKTWEQMYGIDGALKRRNSIQREVEERLNLKKIKQCE